MIASGQRAIRCVEKPNAARAAQELSSGDSEIIAPKRRDVDRDLTHGLTCVHEIRDADGLADNSDGLDILDKSGMRRHPRHVHQAALWIGGERAHGLWIDSAFRQIVGVKDLDAESLGEREE